MSTAVLSPLDFNRTELINARWQNLGTNPTGLTAADKGLMWIVGSELRFWDGTAVQTLGLATGGAASTLEGQTGAYYLDRANHTGTQTTATISDFAEGAQDAVGGILTDTATADLTYDDAAGQIRVSVLDSPTVAGATPAQLRDRATHTGTQASTTISDFTEAAQDAVGGALADTATLDFTYNDATNQITGTVLDSPTVGGATPANLRDRATHTGTQTAATISDFTTAAQGAISVTDTATLDLTKTGGAISGVVLDSPTVGGATPANLRDRATHTGTQTASTISNFDAAVRTSRLDQMAAPTAAVGMGGQKIINLADGTAVTDAATYGQLLAVIEGRTWKDPVRAATTANIALTGVRTIDTVALVAGDRVLVKDQTTAAENGIYIVAAGAWTRAADASTAAELNNATVIVNNGAVNQGDVFTQTAAIATLGTTAQSWVKTGEGQTYAADGTTITLTGNVFSVGTITGTNLADGAVDLTTAKVTGTLPSTKGGTGHATIAVGDLLIGAATNTWARLAGVATGNVLRSGGVGAAPAWGKVGLTTDVTGTLPVANGGTGGTTAAAARTALGATGKFSQDIGGATQITVTHNLNTRDVQVDVYRNSTPWDTVLVDVERDTVNSVVIRFATAPAAAAFRCVVTG